MTTVLLTGAGGFIGRHLSLRLHDTPGLVTREVFRGCPDHDLDAWAGEAGVIFHLAGANRPDNPAGFVADNVRFTERVLAAAAKAGNRPHFILASSVQAARDNPYGRSKRAAEDTAAEWERATGARVTVMRLKNVFGKWCRPNYNSVVATFCHNIARGEPVRVDDPSTVLDLVHVDDVVDAMMRVLADPPEGEWVDDIPSYQISLRHLVDRIRECNARDTTLVVPDMADRFSRLLYGTFITYLEPDRWAYRLDRKQDSRGVLAEFVKSRSFGQLFVSKTRPGVTRGNHYHRSKVEKFLVVAGSAAILLRRIDGSDTIRFDVDGNDCRVVEIPPGYTHSITNTGDAELITLFWANEIFDQERSDTTPLSVLEQP